MTEKAGRRAQTVSLAEIAELFGVTTESIRLWRKEGMPSRTASGQVRFVPTECIKWRREKDRESVSESADDNTKEDRRRLLRADREIREAESARVRGELVPRADFDAELDAFVGGFVGAVSGRLQQWERDIVQATTPGMARIVTDRIQEDVLKGARDYADALEASAEASDTEEEAA